MKLKVKNPVKSATKLVGKITDNKFVQAGIGYYFGGYGGALFGGVYGGKTKKTAQQMYNLTTGHYQRQMNRLAKEEQERQARALEQQKEYAYNQRKAQIDELRERVGAGGTRYRTDRQERKVASSIWGSGNNVETLG